MEDACEHGSHTSRKIIVEIKEAVYKKYRYDASEKEQGSKYFLDSRCAIVEYRLLEKIKSIYHKYGERKGDEYGHLQASQGEEINYLKAGSQARHREKISPSVSCVLASLGYHKCEDGEG